MIAWLCVVVSRETCPPSWRRSSSSHAPGPTGIVQAISLDLWIDGSPTCAPARRGPHLDPREGSPGGVAGAPPPRVEPSAGRGIGARSLLESRMDHRLDKAL